jgi:hypothetical protein
MFGESIVAMSYSGALFGARCEELLYASDWERITLIAA